MSKLSDSIADTDPRQLAALMDPDGERIWGPDELGAILKHQLAAPLQVDLAGLEHGAAGKVKTLAAAQGLLLRSFGDLLRHPHPPIELLRLAKDFAKACRLSPESALPREVATVLYFACIAVALMRCQCRISRLGKAQLREGFEWALKLPWLDAESRRLFRKGLGFVRKMSGGSHE